MASFSREVWGDFCIGLLVVLLLVVGYLAVTIATLEANVLAATKKANLMQLNLDQLRMDDVDLQKNVALAVERINRQMGELITAEELDSQMAVLLGHIVRGRLSLIE